MASGSTLYIIYNASGTVAGKLIYGYRKLTTPSRPKETSQSASAGPGTPKSEPPCAACDITHGGLSLSETTAWTEAKKEIEARNEGLKVTQLHRNEITEKIKAYVKSEGIRYPTVLLEESNSGEFKLVMDQRELIECDGDVRVFVSKLREKGVGQKEQASL